MWRDRLRQAVEPALRRLLHIYWRFARGLTVGARAMVIDRDGKVFLVRHSYVSGWHLPGGGVEAGESVMDALRRELVEEGNIVLTETPPMHGMFFNDRHSNRDHILVFVVRAFRQDAPPEPNREIVAHGFFARDALPNDTTQATRRRLSELFEYAPISERW
jgi:ADP-ribose pyrophosphatase YjhB (NUDIX family)